MGLAIELRYGAKDIGVPGIAGFGFIQKLLGLFRLLLLHVGNGQQQFCMG